MGLFHFVKQDNGVGLAAHGFGEQAAFPVADVAWGRSDEAGNRMLLLEFAHVDGDDAALVAKEGVCQGKACLCLANA